MASFGKLSNSLMSMTNENTLALVNFNVDLSLIRCEPAPEFLAVGSALTARRKLEAENGRIHKTACRLGFLLHDLLPDISKLYKAYGVRVSEILSGPDINPQGTEHDGPFQAFIGADCTSIWAAATSDTSFVAVHLLACMLARAWEAKKAISIWAEIVQVKKGQIQACLELNKIVSPYSAAALRQDISRDDLAAWDASARAWLRRADQSMALQKTQWSLIVDNIKVPYTTSGTTFDKVTGAWTRSMEVLESLLNNLPQQGSDRAILLAVSSWHLFPDLVVFRETATNISFKDSIFPGSGILSLGLEFKGESNERFSKWSLSLSHLRCYGDPVPVTSSETTDRVAFSKLWYMALGTIFRQWSVSYSHFDTSVEWFKELGVVLGQYPGSKCTELSWLLHLCQAASELGQSDSRRQEGFALVRYGWRRAINLLGNNKIIQPAFFGLCNRPAMHALSHDVESERGIAFLRWIASDLGLDVHDAFITCLTTGPVGAYYECIEIATITPADHVVGGNGHGQSRANMRWQYCPERGDEIEAVLQARRAGIVARGELCFVLGNDDADAIPERGTDQDIIWKSPPGLYRTTSSPAVFSPFPHKWENRHRFTLWLRRDRYVEKSDLYHFAMERAPNKAFSIEEGLEWLKGRPPGQGVCQYLQHFLDFRPGTSVAASKSRKRKTDVHTILEMSRKHKSVKRDAGRRDDVLRDYLEVPDTDSGFVMMTGHCRASTEWIISLRVLEIAHKIYEPLPGATVSVRIADQDLLTAHWLPPSVRRISDNINGVQLLQYSFADAVKTPIDVYVKEMTRAQTFACIAMFESGRFNIEPEKLHEVVALCSEDSIFVSGILLADPARSPSGISIRHLVGNVGHAGMVFMVSPLDPKVRPVVDDPRLVEHRIYDGQCLDKVQGTSFHLSFTSWKMPLDWNTTGEIDQEIFLLESVLSVQDSGRWVADIDILELDKNRPDIISQRTVCSCTTKDARKMDVVSLDSWDELLDTPPCVGVFRAFNNWSARLAAASILVQQGKGHCVAIIDGDLPICFNCIAETYSLPEEHVPEILIH